jgi:hypothetical protein
MFATRQAVPCGLSGSGPWQPAQLPGMERGGAGAVFFLSLSLRGHAQQCDLLLSIVGKEASVNVGSFAS